jgi:hypothetical protein
MSPEEYTTATEIAFEKLMNPTRGVRPSLLEEPMAEGKWSFKELSAHFIFWNTLNIQALEALKRGDVFDWSPYTKANENEWNAKAVAKKKDAPLKHVLSELRIVHSTLMEVVTRVGWEKIQESDPSTRNSILEVPDHYLHHVPLVEAWASRVRMPPKK